MGNDSKDSDASAPDSSSDDSNSPPAPPAKSGSSSSTPPPEKSSPSPPSSPPPSPPSSPPPSPPSSPPPSPQIQSPPPAPPSADQRSPPAPSGGSASVSPPVNKPPPTLPTTPAVPDSHRKPTPSGSVPASRGGGSSSSSSLAPPDNQPSKGGSSNNTGLIAGVVVGVVFIIVIAGLCVAIFRRKKKKKAESQIWDSTYKYPDKYHAVSIPPMQGNPSSASYQGSGWPQPAPPPPPGPTTGFNYSTGVQQQVVSPGSSPAPMSSGGGHGQKSFSFDDLVAATNGFSSANMLGQGGFGFVHKGVLPTTGKVVAVKSLKSGSGQGEREFQSEVEIISRVHHRHLVSLVGYCISAAKRLLVYEFVPNNTLEFHLHQSGNVLDFSARLRIALGAAKGLAYLHEDCHPRIIHRDIKASNILLDYNFEAQVADFGLAKLTSDANTHVSTRVMGTFGYLAPEYASSGKLTEKSDVFSFGVMLLELITGRRPVDPNDYNMMEDSLVDWARPLLTKALADKNYDGLADPRLERNYDAQDMLSMVACAASSIRHSSRKRPRMSQIVRALEGQMSLDKLLEGGSKTTKSSDYDTAAYKADMSKFREIALGGDSSNDTSTNTSSEFNLHT